MAQLNGTLIISPIRPNDSLDNFPVVISNEIKGGHHTYDTFLELEFIPTARRSKGMIVTVTNDTDVQLNSSYTLDSDLTTWRYLNELYIVSGQLDGLAANYVWNVLLRSSYRFIVKAIYLKTVVGSAVVSLYVGTNLITDFGGLAANTALNNYVSFDATNYIDVTENLKLLINSVSGNLTSLSIQIELLRVLPDADPGDVLG